MKQIPGIIRGAALLLTGLVLTVRAGHCQQRPVTGQVPLPSTEMHAFHSEVMDQDFLIYVQLPLDFNPTADRKYPVMYATDGNRSFPLLANISTMMGFPPTGLPQVIVVGIAYEIGSMADWAAWRTRDLTPTVNRGTEAYWEGLLERMTGDTAIRVSTGGAGVFLSFISDELIPFIEDTYPVSADDRALAGYSYGGLFTLFALFEKPQLFNRYLAGSPSLHFDNEVIFRLEEDFAGRKPDPGGMLFLSAGEMEGAEVISRLEKLEKTLRARGYPNLEISSFIADGEGHRSAVPSSLMRGFSTLYQ